MGDNKYFIKLLGKIDNSLTNLVISKMSYKLILIIVIKYMTFLKYVNKVSHILILGQNLNALKLLHVTFFWGGAWIKSLNNKILNNLLSFLHCSILNLCCLELAHNCPGWGGSVDWVLVCEPKGHQFDLQSGHMLGLWARSPVGDIREATSQCLSYTSMFLSLSLSLPSLLSKNK